MGKDIFFIASKLYQSGAVRCCGPETVLRLVLLLVLRLWKFQRVSVINNAIYQHVAWRDQFQIQELPTPLFMGGFGTSPVYPFSI